MKCPKCGYNSFETNLLCKKCSQDLSAHKETFGLKPIIFPQEIRSEMAAELASNVDNHAASAPAAEPVNDMFSFDIPEPEAQTASATQTIKDDFFSFADTPVGAPSQGFGDFSLGNEPAEKPKSMDDAFSNLLESTPFSGAANAPAQPAAKPAATSSPAEYELDNFSWDDTPQPATPTAAAQPAKKPEDDFNSLFGEIKK